jgi:hypothetical protein
VFPHYDVKNRLDLEFTFGEALTKLDGTNNRDFCWREDDAA